MNDDLTFGTPDGIDEDEIQQMQQDQEVLNNAVPGEPEQAEQQSTSSPTAQPQQTSKEEPKKEEEGEEGEENILDTAKNAALFAKDATNLPSEALADFAIDTINLIPVLI